ncbi:MAG: Uma2 family endonuclease [Thermomicrobiales bacterium]
MVARAVAAPPPPTTRDSDILEAPTTWADVLVMPEDPGKRQEIIGGELTVSPSPGLDHQTVLDEIYARLSAHVRALGLGRIFGSSVDVKASEYDVVVPDLLFVTAARQDIIRRDAQTIDEPPDLVLEIISPGSAARRRDRIQKLAFYARFGVAEYWLVDPVARTWETLILEGGVYRPLPPEGTIYRSRVVDGFAIDAAEVFAALDALDATDDDAGDVTGDAVAVAGALDEAVEPVAGTEDAG